MQFRIPTPCSAKRPMDDEQLCHRFHKRLRIGETAALQSASPGAGVKLQIDAYEQTNRVLQQLHHEQLTRRQRLPTPTSTSLAASTESFTGGSSSSRDTDAMTSFTLADVVQCSHGLSGRCLNCSGRFVQNVPLPLYCVFCAAYSAPPSTRPTSSFGPPPMTIELSFPALVSLTALLAPEPGERLLHLGSGSGRAVVAWALLVPRGAASGIERCSMLHSAAVQAAGQLDPEVQQRIYLHHQCLFGSVGNWRQATVVIVNAAELDAGALEQVAEGLKTLAPGTRVAAVSRALCPQQSSTPSGFELALQGAFKTAAGSNTTVFIYRRLNTS